MENLKKSYIKAKTILPSLLGWIGISAKPDAPDVFNGLTSSLGDYLTSAGVLTNGMLQIMTAPITDKPGMLHSYIAEDVLKHAIDWAYAGDNPVLIERKFPASLPSSGITYVGQVNGIYRAWLQVPKLIDGDTPNPFVYSQGYRYDFIDGAWKHVGSRHIFSAHSYSWYPVEDYEGVSSSVDVATGVLPVSHAAPSSIAVGSAPPITATDENGQPITAFPINPSWVPSQSQDIAQDIGEISSLEVIILPDDLAELYLVQGKSLFLIASTLKDKTGNQNALQFPNDYISTINSLELSLPPIEGKEF